MSNQLMMINCCAGLKGASQAMIERGWKVITLDNNPLFDPDILTDIRTWTWTGSRPDLMWFSPPCLEFSRSILPWIKSTTKPDMSIYQACKRIVAEVNPRYWIIENIRGALKYFGKPKAIYLPFILWGFFPDPGKVKLDYKPKQSYSSKQATERAKMPYNLSLAVALSIEQSPVSLFD